MVWLVVAIVFVFFYLALKNSRHMENTMVETLSDYETFNSGMLTDKVLNISISVDQVFEVEERGVGNGTQ